MTRIKREDPYKNFKFAIALVGVGVVAVRVGRKLLARKKVIYPGVYVEETPAGARPIEGVGTSTAGFVGSTDKKVSRSSRRARAR